MDSAAPASRTRPFPSARTFQVLAFGFGALLLFLCALGVVEFLRHGDRTRDFGFRLGLGPLEWRVREVAAQGPAAGRIAPDDRIVAIDGHSTRDTHPFDHLALADPGRPLQIDLLRAGRHQRVAVEAVWKQEPARSAGRILPGTVVCLAFVACALLVALLKPAEWLPRLFAATCLLVGANVLRSFAAPWHSQWMPGSHHLWGNLLVDLFTPLEFALGFHCFSSFPPGAPRSSWIVFVRRLLYLVMGLMWLEVHVEQLAWLLPAAPRLALVAGLAPVHDLLFALSSALAEVTDPLGFVALLRNYRLVKSPDERRRASWVIYGSMAALLPSVLRSLIENGWTWLRPGLPPPALVDLGWDIHGVTLIAIPLAVTYAILRHRVLGLEFVLRRGMRYLLAKNSLRALVALPVLALGASILSNPNQTVRQVLFESPGYLLLAAIAAAALASGRRLHGWIDRRFFREAYDREQILDGLARSVRDCSSLEDVAHHVGERVSAALHPSRVHVLYRDPTLGHMSLGHSTGGSLKDLEIPASSPLVTAIDSRGGARELRHLELPADSRELLESMEAQLVVPIAGRDQRLLGLVLLGEKKSEEPYNGTDRKLLDAVAAQIGIVYENLTLRETAEMDRKIRSRVLADLAERNIFPLRECPVCGRCSEGDSDAPCATDGGQPQTTLPVERTIEGRYRLDRRIGSGGMGAVYEAFDLRLDRAVAVKIMTGRLYGDATALKRFEREARAVARLKHPNIVIVHDFGRVGAEGAFLVMERLEGRSLREEILGRGRIAPAMAAEWLDSVLDAIQAAHGEGIVHRDLKPENLFLARDGRGAAVPKVLDFGVAKVLGGDPARGEASFTSLAQAAAGRAALSSESATRAPAGALTEMGQVMGTVAYMSPEQLDGNEVDVRADLFSLGLITVELLTGRHAFEGRDAVERTQAILRREYRFPGESEEARALDRVLRRALAKRPDGRFASAAEMRAALVPLLRSLPESAVPGARPELMDHPTV